MPLKSITKSWAWFHPTPTPMPKKLTPTRIPRKRPNREGIEFMETANETPTKTIDGERRFVLRRVGWKGYQSLMEMIDDQPVRLITRSSTSSWPGCVRISCVRQRNTTADPLRRRPNI